MTTSKVIRVDAEVWAELQRRAIPFEDNPNSVLRRVLKLKKDEVGRDNTREDKMDSRLTKLVNMVGQSGGKYLRIQQVKSGYFGMSSDEGYKGKRFGYVYPQEKGLKVEIKKDLAEKVGRRDWEYERDGYWFKKDTSVYWSILNDDEDAYYSVARLIKALR